MTATSFPTLLAQRDAALTIADGYLFRHDGGAELSPTEKADWADKLERLDALNEQLRYHPDNKIDAEAQRSAADMGRGPDHHGPVGSDSTPAGRAFRSWAMSGDETQLRALGVATGGAGGYMVPEGFRAKVTETMKAFGGVRNLAEIVPTDSGNDLPWPTNNDTANVGHLLAENTTDDEQDVALGQATLGAYMFTSKIVKASFQLMQDTGIDFPAWLARQLGKRIGRAQAPYWVTGTGSGQPQGLIPGLTTGKTTASASAIVYDELLDLVHSVDAAYREGGEIAAGNGPTMPGVAWLMNDQTFGTLRKLKDSSDDRPLLQPDVQKGGPMTLLGYPIQIDNAMPAIAAEASPIVFGNIAAAYAIRDVKQVEVLRFNERYADALQVGFLGYHRSDGLVQDASAAKKLTMHA